MTWLRHSSRSSPCAATVYLGLVCLFFLHATCSPLPAERHSGPFHPALYRRPARNSAPFLHDRSPSAPAQAPASTPPSGKPITISVPCMTIDLSCAMADAQYCANVADSIHRAATRLVSAVQLATTARVRVSFFSKCFDSTCPDTLAATVPSRSLTVWVPDADSTWDPESDDIRRRTGRLVEYPQLVLRNLAARQNSQLLANSGSLLDPEYDVHMRLSADQHWWFPPPPSPHHSSHKPSSRIAPNQFDLSMVVLHELVHALGFGGVNLMQAGNGVNMMLPIAELKSVKDAGDDVGSEHQEVVRFRAPSVFESHLTAASDAATTTMLSDLARDITSAVDDAVHLPANIDTVNQALGHPSALHAASTLYSLATTPGAVTFSASPGGASAPGAPLMIETALTPLSPGSSLAHISQARYAESPDFLMTYQIPRGKSLDQLIGALGAGESGLGPRTLDVIRALGFKVKGRGDGDGEGNGDVQRLSDRAYVLDRVVVADLDRTFVPLVPGGGKVDGNGMRNAAAGYKSVSVSARWVWIGVMVLGLGVW